MQVPRPKCLSTIPLQDGWVFSRQMKWWRASHQGNQSHVRHWCFSLHWFIFDPMLSRHCEQFCQLKLVLIQINAGINAKNLPFAFSLTTHIAKSKRKSVKAQIYSKPSLLTEEMYKSEIPVVFFGLKQHFPGCY